MAAVTLNFVPPTDPGYSSLHIFESATGAGPFEEIEVVTAIGTYPDYITTYTTNLAGAISNWFAIAWTNSAGAQTQLSSPLQGATTTAVAEVVRRSMLRDPFLNEAIVTQEAEASIYAMFGLDPYDPTISPTPTQYSDLVIDTIGRTKGYILPEGGYSAIPSMASLNDINAFLDGGVIPPEKAVVTATSENTALIQIEVVRMIRGYLGRVYSVTTLYSWNTPETTPDIIRVIAALLIASQLYMDKVSGQEFSVEDRHYSQILYDRAIMMLEMIIDGSLIVIDPTTGLPVDQDTPEGLTTLDFFPVDATDRAFTMSMRLD